MQKKLKKKEIKKILIDAIEQKAKQLEEYRKTPTREHLEKIVSELDLADDSSVMLIAYNPTTKSLTYKGIKTKASTQVAIAMYALAHLAHNDVSSVMDCVSTVMRQEELNDCWVENNVKPEELKDE